MNKIKSYELMLGDKKLVVEKGKLAQQANGSCLVRLEDTVLLVTATDGESRPGTDFFPFWII